MIRLITSFLLAICSLPMIGQSPDVDQGTALKVISEKYQLSLAQQDQVKQILANRDAALLNVSANSQLDELQKAQKRSSIDKGFEGSLNLILNENQKKFDHQNIIKQREERIAIIENLKKEGYSQEAIIKYLKNNKVNITHE